jgi:lipid-A-disaccharide synthase
VTRPVCIMLVAGEASGDALGARLARALRKRFGEGGVRFVGVGGAQMAAEGVVSPFDLSEISVLGVFEGLLRYRQIIARVNDAAELAVREKPDIAVLIDSWGFTVRVARRLRALDPGLPLVKYVGTQVWAWRAGRAKVLAAAVDHLLSIHAFEPPYFEREGLKTTFVGNPALARDPSRADPARLRAAVGADAGDPILLVLPGSRQGEIKRMSPPFGDAVRLLKASHPNLRIVVPAAATVAQQVKDQVASWIPGVDVIEDEGLKFDAMAAATVALACSGTVTTELALAGCPVVVAYRLGPMTYLVLRAMIRTPYVTLFNIVAQKFIAPELIQNDCNGPSLAAAVAERLDDAALRTRQIAEQNAAVEKMGRGGPDPSERAADVIVQMLEARKAAG